MIAPVPCRFIETDLQNNPDHIGCEDLFMIGELDCADSYGYTNQVAEQVATESSETTLSPELCNMHTSPFFARTLITKNGTMSKNYLIRSSVFFCEFSVFSAIFVKSFDCFLVSESCFSDTLNLAAVNPPPPIFAREESL